MNHNLNKPQNSNRPYMLEFQVRDGGGAQEEPYMGVQSAHAQSGNPWTGCGPTGLATSAQVNKTPRHISSEAEDVDSPGRGSCSSYTDPFRSLTFRGKEPPKDHSMINMSDDKSSMPSTDEDKHTEPITGVCIFQWGGSEVWGGGKMHLARRMETGEIWTGNFFFQRGVS